MHKPLRDTAGAGLKAAWYGAEVLGKLVSGGKKGQQDAASTRKRASWEEVKSGIRADYDENYFVSGTAAMDVYDPQCEFADPFVSFRGVERFKQNLANFGKLTEDVKVKVTSFEEIDERTLKVSWRFSCLLKVPWNPVLAAAGAYTPNVHNNCNVHKACATGAFLATVSGNYPGS